jgi:hypothetical protein
MFGRITTETTKDFLPKHKRKTTPEVGPDDFTGQW